MGQQLLTLLLIVPIRSFALEAHAAHPSSWPFLGLRPMMRMQFFDTRRKNSQDAGEETKTKTKKRDGTLSEWPKHQKAEVPDGRNPLHVCFIRMLFTKPPKDIPTSEPEAASRAKTEALAAGRGGRDSPGSGGTAEGCPRNQPRETSGSNVTQVLQGETASDFDNPEKNEKHDLRMSPQV